MTSAPRQARQRRLRKLLQRADLLAWVVLLLSLVFLAWHNLRQSQARAAHEQFDLILLELSRADGHGLGLLEELRQLHPRLPVVVLSCSELSGEQLSLVDAALGRSRMDTQHLLTILARLLPAKEPSNA